MDIPKSFADKHNLPLEKVHKFNSAARRTHEPIIRSYKSTKILDARLDAFQAMIQVHVKKSVDHSTIIRSLIQLAARDEGVRQKLLAVIAQENVYRGRIQKQLS